MESFNFIGRPDGIGNRIEEIMAVSAYCSKRNIRANYVWSDKIIKRTSYRHFIRRHDIFLTSDNVSITKKVVQGIPTISDIGDTIIYDSCIRPTFNIQFDNTPIGVHIRGTDRISDIDHPHFMKSKDELYDYISRTASIINTIHPGYVYVCSESKRYSNMFVRKLDSGINVVTPVCDKGIPAEYRDFFALTLCSGIYMCSRFSSFSITASLVGGVPIFSFINDASVAKRYGAMFRYI